MDAVRPDNDKPFIPEGLHRAPTILVVDDDPHVCKLLQFYLRRSHSEVMVASDGPQALQRLEASPGVDLVLLDLRMPGMDGIETLRRINALDKAGSVIVMTAYGTMEEAITALKEGAYDFVKKNAGLDDLRLSIRNALQTVGLREEVQHLRARLDEHENPFPEIVSRSPGMQQVKKLIRKVAGRGITVLIEGESGVGKELVARAIHSHSDLRDKPFVAVNCAAIPENLLESELFGHQRGAFTGATARRVGKFEEAHGGTLFLDEVGELPLNLQAKLLRVLQTKEVEPLGGQPRRVNVRIVSATNQHLAEAVHRGRFRQDLFYRLAVFPIHLPPLRQRPEDIPRLAHYFVDKFAGQEGRRIDGLAPEVEAALLRYDWPGNVRELENMIYRAVVLSEAHRLELEDFPVFSVGPPPPEARPPVASRPLRQSAGGPGAGARPSGGVRSLERTEAHAIRDAVASTNGNVSHAAELLGISRATLYRKARKLHIALR